MNNTLKKECLKPFLYFRNSLINEVNTRFINLTGYLEEELIGKSIEEVNFLLRCNSQINMNNVQNSCDCYIFTKCLKPIEVTISSELSECDNGKKMVFNEKSNSQIKEKFALVEQFYEDNKVGVAFRSYPELIFLGSNQKFLDFLEEPYSIRENSIGKKWGEILVGYKGSALEKMWQRVLKTAKPNYANEIEYIHKERGITYWDSSIIPIYVEGKIKYLIETCVDVTDKVLNRKYIEEQAKIIEEQKKELEAIIENMSDGLFTVNKDHEISFLNGSVKDFFYNPESIKKIGDALSHTNYFDADGNVIKLENLPACRVLRGEGFKEYRMKCIRPDGTFHLNMSGSSICDKRGNIEKAIICCRNVSERVKSEENLIIKTHYDLLNGMMEHIDINLLRISYPEFVILDVNKKEFMHFNKIKPRSDIKGKSLLEFMDENKKAEFLSDISDITDKKSASNFRIERYVLDGKEKFVKKLYQPVFGLNNEIQEIVVISFDVTNEIKANNQMEKNLKMQEELLANISHELKTPLNVIFSTSQLFELYLKNGSFINNKDKISNNIHGIKQNCYRLTKLIGNIVDLSKIKSGFFELNLSNENIVNITEEIVQSISEYVEGKGFHITFDTVIEEKIIACDPEKIERIILNLISNAIKFSEFGDEIFVNFIDNGESVEISVKDRGIGIDKNHLDSIFQRFHQENNSFTRNVEGSGIGLYLVKSIVEMHGGKISAESKLGEGSIFKIELPSRVIERQNCVDKAKSQNSKVERINIEFSDIYSM